MVQIEIETQGSFKSFSLHLLVKIRLNCGIFNSSKVTSSLFLAVSCYFSNFLDNVANLIDLTNQLLG